MRFVLVHGGLHGAWCWERVSPELKKFGHEVIAIDLAGHGERVREKGTLDSYRRSLVEVVEDGDILVGHSMGGFVISMAADEVPEKVGRLIYLAAAVPVEGKSMAQAMPFQDIGLEKVISRVETPEQGACFVMPEFEAAANFFYHDCSLQDQRWAFDRLTPQPLAPSSAPIHVPRLWTSSIPRNYIICTEDRSHPHECDNLGMQMLGLKHCLGLNTSHSPFLSQPAETAKLLNVCATGVL